MWKGEWKAYVAWWLGWLLVAFIAAAVAVCIFTSRQRARPVSPPAQHQSP